MRMTPTWWWTVLVLAWCVGVWLLLRALSHMSRRDDEAIIDHEFNQITRGAEHDYRWDDERDT